MTLTSILIGLAAAVVVFFVQPLLLQAAASVSGEKPAGYFASFAALFAAAIANVITGVIYGLTLGALIATINSTVAIFSGVMLAFVVSGVTYSAFLRVPVFNGIKVALFHHVIAALFTGAIALMLNTLAGVGLFAF